MRKEIIRNWIIIFILLAIICAGIMGVYYLLFRGSSGFDFKDLENNEEVNNHEITTKIPLFNNGNLNKSLDTLIDNKKNSFTSDEESNKMDISYSYSIHSNLYTFHYKTLYYKDDNITKRDDDFKYYDSISNEEIDIDKLITRNDEYNTKIKYVVNNYLNDHKDITFNDSYLNNLVFSEDKIYIIVPNEEKDINIPIEYLDIKKFLNSDYFTVDGEYEDVPQTEDTTKTETSENETTKEETTTKDTTEKKTTTTTKKSTTTEEKITTKEELKSTNDGSQDKAKAVTRDASYFAGKKLICFTFDDGPSKYTTKLLDGLQERNAKVTFFMVGNRVNSYKNTVLRMKNEGHTLGIHSYSHKNLTKLDETAAKNEIYLALDAVKNITGENPRYMRPPYGSYNQTVLTYADLVFVNWSIDPLDWKYKNANTVYNNIISKAYDGAVVLVHDLYETSVDGALMAMDYLEEQGYAFVSLDEMVSLRGLTLETHHLYNQFKK